MAEKHKSKYKTPKDFEKSHKPKLRKDIKDYTHDDKSGGLNPFATGEVQKKVARKNDKAVQDDGKMFPKYADKDRLYNPQTAKYDPKHASKVLNTRQKVDSDEYLEKLELIDHGATTAELQEKINKLSLSQKERLIREYLRRKILKVLKEQTEEPADKEEPDTAEVPDAPAEPPATPEPAAEPPTPASPAPAAPAPAAPAPASPTSTEPAATDTTTPADTKEPGEADVKKDVEQQEAENILAVKNWLEFLKQKQQRGPKSIVSAAISPLAKLITKFAPEELERAKNLAIRQIRSIKLPDTANNSDADQTTT